MRLAADISIEMSESVLPTSIQRSSSAPTAPSSPHDPHPSSSPEEQALLFETTIKKAMEWVEEDAKYMDEVMTEQLESKKSAVGTVNAFIAVTNSLQGVLIAGVQAQGLASTYTLHDTKLQAVTNASGFIGLILDIIGALFGVVNAILLQKSISMYQKLLLSQPSRTNQRKQQLRDLMTLVTSDGPAAVAGRARIIKQLQGEIRRSKSELRPHAPNWKARISLLFRLVQDHRLILLCIIPLSILVVEVFIFVAEAFWDRGQLPVALMSLGIACFLIFVLCFATSSQPEPIWIACIAVTTLGVVYSSYVMYVNRPMRNDEKEEFFRNLSAPSEQLPGSPVDRPRREHVTIF